MRGLGTWLLVVALAGLGLVATVDALVGEGDSPRRAARSTTTVPLLAEQPDLAVSQLREAGVSGLLTYSDEDCRLHAVSLPELEPVPAPSFESCEPHIPSGGIGTLDGDVVWSGLGFQTVQLVLAKEELTRAVRPHGFGEEAAFRAVQAASLGAERYVVLADFEDLPGRRILAAVEGKKAVFVSEWNAEVVRPSPRGGYYALLRPNLFLALFTRDGHQIQPPSIPEAHAVTWSPDDTWTALATERSVYVFPSEQPSSPVVRIPLAVRDLDWGE